jgi:hypothetical protein
MCHTEVVLLGAIRSFYHDLIEVIPMLRFKQFSGSGSDFEHAVNAWLEQIEPDVTQMVQTVDDSGRVTIGFLFEESGVKNSGLPPSARWSAPPGPL